MKNVKRRCQCCGYNTTDTVVYDIKTKRPRPVSSSGTRIYDHNSIITHHRVRLCKDCNEIYQHTPDRIILQALDAGPKVKLA